MKCSFSSWTAGSAVHRDTGLTLREMVASLADGGSIDQASHELWVPRDTIINALQAYVGVVVPAIERDVCASLEICIYANVIGATLQNLVAAYELGEPCCWGAYSCLLFRDAERLLYWADCHHRVGLR